MNATQIKVTGVERKEGTAKATGKPWTRFDIHADGGTKYSTFDAALAKAGIDAVGQFASITYETNEYGNDLKSLIAESNGAAPPDPEPVLRPPAPAAQTSNGDVDWDLIGLRKTRCALWAALFSGNTLAGMPESVAITTGVGLVRGAEIDIFTREPAQAGDDIPF